MKRNKKINKKLVLLFLYGLILGLAIVFAWNQTQKYMYRLEHPYSYAWYKKADVVVSGTHFVADVADTEPLREQGLSGRPGLGKHRAMLFVFDRPGMYPFWMRDMFIAIDIVWLNSEKRVIHMEKNLSPKSFPKTFKPDTDALYVLEMPSGSADILKISEGDAIKMAL